MDSATLFLIYLILIFYLFLLICHEIYFLNLYIFIASCFQTWHVDPDCEKLITETS